MKNYTTRQVADVLQLDPEVVRRYVRGGKIKAFKIGNSWRVKEEDLKLFIDGRETNKEAE